MWSPKSHFLTFARIFSTATPLKKNTHLIRNRNAFKKLSQSLHTHQIHFGISYSGGEDDWKTWRMSAGESLQRGRERCRKAGKMIDFHRFFPPPLNPGHLVVVRMGQKQLAATCQVKLQTQTIKVWHVLSWKMITWPLWMDNPLKADQRKSKFWSRLQRVFTCRQSRCRRLQHLIQLRLRAADHWRPLQLLYMQMLQRQINSWKWQQTS